MIGAPDVDAALISALKFVVVIDDVAREIGRARILADDDAILFVAELR